MRAARARTLSIRVSTRQWRLVVTWRNAFVRRARMLGMFLVNAFGAILLLPALAAYLVGDRRKVGTSPPPLAQ